MWFNGCGSYVLCIGVVVFRWPVWGVVSRENRRDTCILAYRHCPAKSGGPKETCSQKVRRGETSLFLDFVDTTLGGLPDFRFWFFHDDVNSPPTLVYPEIKSTSTICGVPLS